jgi:hypothetical protein
MAEIVSLNQFRKARERAKATSEASGNKLRHGRTKAEKQRDAAERDLQARAQDVNRLERKDGPPDTD